jgi:hypothetical protein
MHIFTAQELDAVVRAQAQIGPSISFHHVLRCEQFDLAPGIYFGMPADVYHAIPALSSTGLKNLLISAPDFYFNSWLNPLRDEDNEDGESKEWQKFGEASHIRNLEGKTVFDKLYCVEFLAPEGCLESTADLKGWVSSRGLDMKGLNSSKWIKQQWIDFVVSIDPNVCIYDIEKDKYWRETGGKIQLSEKELRRIQIAAAMIEKHPELRHAFTGGYPEVTVIWIEECINPITGKIELIWFKARFDYLKPRAIVDLKTFTNKRHKPIDMAIHETMAAMKYHIQVGLYTRAAEWASSFARVGITTTYSVERYGPDQEFLKFLGENVSGHDFFNVWQKKGGAPLARGKKFPRGLNMMACAMGSIDMAVSLYQKYLTEFGDGVWVDKSSITDYEDALFPVYATEI